LLAAAFLARVQTKSVSACSLVQASGAPARPSTAARDPGFNGSLRSLRIALGVRLLRRRSQTKKRVCSLLLSLAARDPGAEPGYA
jgi:hypothetical protein